MQGYYRLNTTILSDTYNISTTCLGLYGHRQVDTVSDEKTTQYNMVQYKY